jgi:hypothetical protein
MNYTSQSPNFWQQHAALMANSLTTQGQNSTQTFSPIQIPNFQQPNSFAPSNSIPTPRFVKCPVCNMLIPKIGSTFFLHLNKCNPDYFFSWVQSGEVPTPYYTADS